MIWGPVFPLTRDSVWNLVRSEPVRIERGLRFVVESLDLGTGDLGVVDGLMRDAVGNPVLVFVSDANDCTLIGRVVAAHAFWRRNHRGLARAIPEAQLRDASACRVLVVSAALPHDIGEMLGRLGIERLEILEIERFHIGKQDRLVLRNRKHEAAPPQAELEQLESAIAPASRKLLTTLSTLLGRLGPRIRIDGDRFSRHATSDGQVLCECWYADDAVHASMPDAQPVEIGSVDDARAFVDLVARRHLALLRGEAERPAAAAPQSHTEDSEPAAAPSRSGLDTLRASLSLAQLSREEWSALGDSTPEDSHRQGG